MSSCLPSLPTWPLLACLQRSKLPHAQACGEAAHFPMIFTCQSGVGAAFPPAIAAPPLANTALLWGACCSCGHLSPLHRHHLPTPPTPLAPPRSLCTLVPGSCCCPPSLSHVPPLSWGSSRLTQSPSHTWTSSDPMGNFMPLGPPFLRVT